MLHLSVKVNNVIAVNLKQPKLLLTENPTFFDILMDVLVT